MERSKHKNHIELHGIAPPQFKGSWLTDIAPKIWPISRFVAVRS
ncbi:hypothetical protein BH10PLA1_BH10PLA1_04630 [soil metagenome]